MPWIRRILALLIVGVTGWALFAEPMQAPRPAAPGKVDFSRDVLPILSNNCFMCHGPDEGTRKAKLRLDQRESATKLNRAGDAAIVPGDAKKSELVRRILASDTDQMPPPASHKKLSAEQKDILAKWIAEGAEYKLHWAFVKPTRPAIPAVKGKDWVQNEIDAFILDRLEKASLKPSAVAEKTALIRRLSIDLRGLPPTLAEQDQFLNDTSPDAYAKLVDRMLHSPRYGEKLALLWMDCARFGDTSGFHFDSYRQMWPWRDWVIKAYNDNLPFDQFTVWQLAGDLLPNATMEQKIASGFNRNTRFNEEGGADPNEFVIRYNVDRTSTLGQVWLGMTLGCAECHSHKYDPISHKEFYQLYAYFTGINEPMTSGNHGQPLPPLMKVPTADQTRDLETFKKSQAAAQEKLTAALKAIVYKDPLEGKAAEFKPQTAEDDVVWIDDKTPDGAVLQPSPADFGWVEKPEPVLVGRKAMKRSAAGLTQHYFTGATSPLKVGEGDKLFCYVYLDPKNPPKSVMLQFNDGSWEHRAYWGEDKCFLSGSPSAPNHFNAGPLPKPGEWTRLEIEAAKLGLNPGALINGAAYTQFDGTVYWDKAGIRTQAPDPRGADSLIAWEILNKDSKALPPEIQALLKAPKRDAAQSAALQQYYLLKVYSGTRGLIAEMDRTVDDLNKKVKETEDAIPHTLISEEMKEPRPAHVLIRGDFLQKGEKVDRGTPAVFPPLPKDAPNNRLGLAQWLVSPDHPLTSRVVVNRLWTQMFGTGLVKTVGDFGSQGEYPSHPELLDWLGTEFMASGWDTRAMLKKIAMSNTYRQSSARVGPVPAVDPNNRLYSRAPRHRLGAEEIRDNALTIAGLLSPRIGGPSVRPYQPGDFYKGKYEAWTWEISKGDDQHRRGMYTFWRRTSLHPMFAIFDAPSREECVVFRQKTNTPLHALVTLNDPTFVEAARVFAQSILTEGPADLDGRITHAFRRAVVRMPKDNERATLTKYHAQMLKRFQADPKDAAQLVAVGIAARPEGLDPAEHAAWTMIASILLNLDETQTRE